MEQKEHTLGKQTIDVNERAASSSSSPSLFHPHLNSFQITHLSLLHLTPWNKIFWKPGKSRERFPSRLFDTSSSLSMLFGQSRKPCRSSKPFQMVMKLDKVIIPPFYFPDKLSVGDFNFIPCLRVREIERT